MRETSPPLLECAALSGQQAELEVDFTPNFPRQTLVDRAKSPLLDNRGLTSHASQTEIWDKRVIQRESILSKLLEAGANDLATKLSICGRDKLYIRCGDCRREKVVFSRCDLGWCPCCQPRISRERKESLEWWSKSISKPVHLVLTARNSETITKERLQFLKSALAKLRRRSIFRPVRGGMWSMEVTNEGRGWHVHFHLLLDTPFIPIQEISRVWAELIGQDFSICHAKRVTGDSYLKEVTKYTVKGSQLAGWEPGDVVAFIRAIDGVRCFGVFGSLFGRRAEFKLWLESLQQEKELCECGGCNWVVLSENEWEAEGCRGDPVALRKQEAATQLSLLTPTTRGHWLGGL